MADIVYKVNQDSPENIVGFEHYSEKDKVLLASFQINSVFDPNKNYSELHVLSLSDELLESNYNYTGFKQLGNAQSAGQEGASVLTIDPIEDSKALGYVNGGIKLLYHFLDDLYTQDKSISDFYIQDISTDRTELSLASKTLSPEDIVSITKAIKDNLQSQSYFTGFRLNFKDNDLLIATNIDTLDSSIGKVVVVKLYEPLPTNYGIKSILNIVDLVSDSVAYEVDSEYIIPPALPATLASPNFNIDVTDNSVVPTSYFNYNELFSYPINNSNSQIFSTINELGAEISVDYTDFSNFVHFSSAQERLLNFKYKLDLISNYSASLSSIASATTGLQGVSGSKDYYQNLITGIVNNFDHYERFLYYESGSTSWPKSNKTKPYVNKASNTSEAITWYTGQVTKAIKYDQTNYNSLAYSIPSFLRDDANNENYTVFVYMIGQHFDNLWLYSKAVTDKYDADNRIDHGISKDLVGEALRNFGVKLYTSNKSVQDLFTTFIGQTYQSGSEKINNYITGSLTGSNASIQPTSYDDYQKEVYKRIYHNLPLLIKSKGTERGLRALINCLGIPSDILKIKLYGGRNINERPFYGDYRYFTSSLDKIRLDNTGSIVSGSTLSNYTSIIKRDDKYTDDLHPIEVGFSPTDNVDNYIISKSLSTASLASFNIDDYLGDPRNLTQDAYYNFSSTSVATTNLTDLTNRIMSGSTAYNVQDYVKLIKFFDNTVFKMVKDFLPARAVADTGIILKPHILGRSKAKSLTLSGSTPTYTGSIDTAFISAGGTNNFRSFYNSTNGGADTRYVDVVQTPTGIDAVNRRPHNSGEVNYNGEVSGSVLAVSKRDLNSANPYKTLSYVTHPYNVYFVSKSNEVCLLDTKSLASTLITDPNQLYSQDAFFSFTNANCEYSASSDGGTTWIKPVTFPITFPITGLTYTPGTIQTIKIKALNKDVVGGTCNKTTTLQYAPCTFYFSPSIADLTTVPKASPGIQPTDLTNWVVNPNGQLLQYTASYTISSTDYIIPLPGALSSSYNFTQPEGTSVTITIKDTALGSQCQLTKTVTVTSCGLGKRSYNPTEAQVGFEVGLSYHKTAKAYPGLTQYSYTDPQTGTIVLTTLNPQQSWVTDTGGQISLDQTGMLKVYTEYLGNGYVVTNSAYVNTPKYRVARYKGIQEYFKNNGNFSGAGGVSQNTQLRYNIYEMTNINLYAGYSDQSTNIEGYDLKAIALNINPFDAQTSWTIQDWAVDTYAFLTIDYQNINGLGYVGFGDAFLNSTSAIAARPIVLQLPFTDVYTYDEAYNTATNTPGDITQQPRAYLLECYKLNPQGGPVCKQQVVVYTKHNAAIEGPGAYPQFTKKTILAGWEYTPLTSNIVIGPGTTPPNFPGAAPLYGPYAWIDTKVRTYATAPGTSGTGDNIPPI